MNVSTADSAFIGELVMMFVFSFIVAIAGRKKRTGYWGLFIISVAAYFIILFLTKSDFSAIIGPLIALIIGVILPKEIKEEKVSDVSATDPAPARPKKIWSAGTFIGLAILIIGFAWAFVQDSKKSNAEINSSVVQSERIVHIDGYDPSSHYTIQRISIWNVPDDDRRKLTTTCNDGESVTEKGITTDGNGTKWIHIEKFDGKEGWVKYWFVKEYK